MIQRAHRGACVQFFAFNEVGGDCVERREAPLAAKVVNGLENGAIELAVPEGAAGVPRKGRFLPFVGLLEVPTGLLQKSQTVSVSQVKTIPQVDHRANHRWLWQTQPLGPFLGSFGVVRPKVDAVSKPVIIVGARGETLPSGHHLQDQGPPTTVVAQDNWPRQHGRASVKPGRCCGLPPGPLALPGGFQQADTLQEFQALSGRRENLPRRLAHLRDLGRDLFPRRVTQEHIHCCPA